MEEENCYLTIGTAIASAQQSQMFGKSCFKINGKAFICFFQNALVCKLQGVAHQDAMALDGSQLFDPSGKGRPMKEWVQISYEHKGAWNHYADAAMRYVSGSN